MLNFIRDFVCENGDFCHAVNQIVLLSFGGSVMISSVSSLA